MKAEYLEKNTQEARELFLAGFKAPPAYAEAKDAGEAGAIFDKLTPAPKAEDPEEVKAAYAKNRAAFLEAFAGFDRDRAAFVAGILARLEKGGPLDPESNDPSTDWQPCGQADAVFYLAEIAKETVDGKGRMIRDVLEPGFEHDALCYVKPPSAAWLQRMNRRQEGAYRGLHVDKHGELVCPPELKNRADDEGRTLEWYFAVEVPDARRDAGLNPRSYRRFWRWFQVEEWVWAGLFIE